MVTMRAFKNYVCQKEHPKNNKKKNLVLFNKAGKKLNKNKGRLHAIGTCMDQAV